MERETATRKQETATGNCLTTPFSNCMDRFLSWCAVKTGLLCETCHLNSQVNNDDNKK